MISCTNYFESELDIKIAFVPYHDAWIAVVVGFISTGMDFKVGSKYP